MIRSNPTLTMSEAASITWVPGSILDPGSVGQWVSEQILKR
ncbi:hypothetical protein [Glutamicibacter arilaitensis]